MPVLAGRLVLSFRCTLRYLDNLSFPKVSLVSSNFSSFACHQFFLIWHMDSWTRFRSLNAYVSNFFLHFQIENSIFEFFYLHLLTFLTILIFAETLQQDSNTQHIRFFLHQGLHWGYYTIRLFLDRAISDFVLLIASLNWILHRPKMRKSPVNVVFSDFSNSFSKANSLKSSVKVTIENFFLKNQKCFFGETFLFFFRSIISPFLRPLDGKYRSATAPLVDLLLFKSAFLLLLHNVGI